MKTIQVTEEWYNAAKKMAEYLDNEDTQWDSLFTVVSEGDDPNQHVLAHASVVGDWRDKFVNTVEEYRK